MYKYEEFSWFCTGLGLLEIPWECGIELPGFLVNSPTDIVLPFLFVGRTRMEQPFVLPAFLVYCAVSIYGYNSMKSSPSSHINKHKIYGVSLDLKLRVWDVIPEFLRMGWTNIPLSGLRIKDSSYSAHHLWATTRLNTAGCAWAYSCF